MEAELRILNLEDDALDSELVGKLLEQEGIFSQIRRVETMADFERELNGTDYDLIISDYTIPGMDAMQALQRSQEIRAEIPFIFVSGTLGEEQAIEAMKRGASDYVLKQRIDRLGLAIKRALKESKERQRRQKAEEALRESEEQFRIMANAIPQLAWMAGPDGRIVWYNQRWFEYTGTTLGEKDPTGWKTPCDPKILPEVIERWDHSIRTGEPFDMEFPLRGKGGLYRAFLTRMMPVKDTQGKVARWFGTCTDVSELRETEQQVRLQAAALQAAADAVLITDNEGFIIWANSAFERLTGYTAAEAFGRTPRLLKSGKHEDPFYQELWQSILAGQVWRSELINRRKDGSLYHEQMSITPVRDQRGTITHFVAIKMDVTERKQAERALRASEARFRAFFNNAAIGAAQLDPQGRFIQVNDRLCQMVGYSREELLGKSPLELDHEEDRPADTEHLARYFRGEIPVYDTQKRFVRKDGRTIWVHATSALIRDAEGRILHTASLVEDITQAREDQERVRRSEAVYRAIARSIPDGLVTVVDPNLRILVAEGELLKKTRLSTEQMEGHTLAEVFSAETLRLIEPSYRRTLAGGTTSYETQIGNLWLWTQYVPLRDEDGQVKAAMALVLDITRQKQAETELRESQARLQASFDNAAMGIVEVDERDRFVAVNNRVCEILGYSREELLQMDVHRLTAPEDRELTNRLNTELHLGRRDRIEYEKRYLRRDGSPFWVHVTVSAIRDVAGKPIHSIGTIEDISERKLSGEVLERQAALIDLTPAAIIARSVDGTIKVWNKGAETLYGWSNQEASGRRTHELLQTTFPQPFEEIMAAAFRPDGWSGELHQKTKDGRTLVVQSWWQARASGSGEPEILESNMDVTIRKEFQDKLERLVAERTAKLRETIGELEHFSYTLVHDMRAPLRAMQGFGEILMEEARDHLSPTENEFVSRIMTAAERMDNLITDALNYSRIVRQEFTLSPVAVEPLLREMIDTYPEFHSEAVQIEVKAPLPPVLGNKAGLTQCFSNLLNNALKFRKPGQSAHVLIRAEERGEKVRLWFEDNGIGIEPEYQEQIFEMFRQLHRGYQGTGIGLALVRKAAERMGGQVGVESEFGVGSRFWLEFQRALPNPSPMDSQNIRLKAGIH